MRPSIRIYFDTLLDADIIKYLDGFSSAVERNNDIRNILRRNITGSDGAMTEVLRRLDRIEAKMSSKNILQTVYDENKTIITDNAIINTQAQDIFEQALRDIGVDG